MGVSFFVLGPIQTLIDRGRFTGSTDPLYVPKAGVKG
jgi:hypothetical protein